LNHPSNIPISDFTYDLPQEKIAVYPLKDRDQSKLLVFKNGQITESVFQKIDSYLEEGAVLVFNNTKVIQARLKFLNAGKKPIEIFCLEPSSKDQELSKAMLVKGTTRWNCLVGNLKQWKENELALEKGELKLTVSIVQSLANYFVIEFKWTPASLSFAEVLEIAGNMPIPPYLKRESEEKDASSYQTIYAEKEGSVAAPTAGLHFTEQVMNKLKHKQIQTLPVTLHIGAGTFKPVKAPTMKGHDMHAEWLEIDTAVVRSLANLSTSSGQVNKDQQIIAVGTTSLRTLESLYWMGVKLLLNKNISNTEDLVVLQWEVYDLPGNYTVKESFHALIAWLEKNKMDRLLVRTQILIAPPYELKMADGLITNFHQPQSTLLLLVSAVVGNKWKEIYNYALEHDFRFLSYGDSSLLLK
jgi:S-adenosylmethionine:tRNA ribosyltransferase-isomerase